MTEKTKLIMARRLRDLMSKYPSLNTLEKVQKKSGASFGTVRRVRNAEETDVQIGNVERIAACFRLTLAEFVSDPDNVLDITESERQILKDLRTLDADDANGYAHQISRMAQMKKASSSAEAIQREAKSVQGIVAIVPHARRNQKKLPQ